MKSQISNFKSVPGIAIPGLALLLALGCQAPKPQLTSKLMSGPAAWSPTTPPGNCGKGVTMPNMFLWRQPDFDWRYPYCWLPGYPWLEGDVDFNGFVNIFDILQIRNLCLNRPGVPDYRFGDYFNCGLADLNHDGLVNVLDLVLVRQNLNKSVPMSYVNGRWEE